METLTSDLHDMAQSRIAKVPILILAKGLEQRGTMSWHSKQIFICTVNSLCVSASTLAPEEATSGRLTPSECAICAHYLDVNDT